jgi:hypothetical protein
MHDIDMGNFMNRICIVSRESYIKARIIKIKSANEYYIDETIKLASNGISLMLLSHARVSDGYQMFLDSEADGKMICQQILDVLSRMPDGNVVIERINC